MIESVNGEQEVLQKSEKAGMPIIVGEEVPFPRKTRNLLVTYSRKDSSTRRIENSRVLIASEIVFEMSFRFRLTLAGASNVATSPPVGAIAYLAPGMSAAGTPFARRSSSIARSSASSLSDSASRHLNRASSCRPRAQ